MLPPLGWSQVRIRNPPASTAVVWPQGPLLKSLLPSLALLLRPVVAVVAALALVGVAVVGFDVAVVQLPKPALLWHCSLPDCH